MKKVFFIFTFICLSIAQSYAQFDIAVIDKSLAKINDTLYASKYEVSNKQYRNYINYLKQKNKVTELNIVQIDSAQWRATEFNNEPFAQYYHIHPAYDNYPVVNISYKAATLYCKWLTENYNTDSKRKFKKVIFNLPSEKEWMMAAKNGEVSDTAKKKLNDDFNIMAVDANKCNSFGLYNFTGNIEEMLNQKGVAKGGDWKHGTKYVSIGDNFLYDGNPKPFIGFRYFAVVVEK
jgi:formylglycine-generating enzyme required for sulfatase activity